jgi:hypothetical protein
MACLCVLANSANLNSNSLTVSIAAASAFCLSSSLFFLQLFDSTRHRTKTKNLHEQGKGNQVGGTTRFELKMGLTQRDQMLLRPPFYLGATLLLDSLLLFWKGGNAGKRMKSYSRAEAI